MITLPEWTVLVAWLLLCGLGALVILMYRQLAYLLKISHSSEARTGGLDLGDRAPSFTYRLVRGDQVDVETRTLDPGRSPLLLMFTDPRCRSCETMIDALEEMADSDPYKAIRVLVVTDARREVVAALGSYSRTRLEVGRVSGSVAERLYRVPATPFAYGIDPVGVIQSKGAHAQLASGPRCKRATGVGSFKSSQLTKEDLHPWHNEYRPQSASARRSMTCSSRRRPCRACWSRSPA